MPFNDVEISPVGNEIRVNFSSMESVCGEGGRVFFGRHRPKIHFEGLEYTVAFSRHAIERICQRINPKYIEYGPAGDIHAIFSTCVYFEPVMLYGDQPAFALFELCGNKGFAHYQNYTADIFGEENVKPGKRDMYYRVGYCPVAFESCFAKAITFLPPGFRGTPEYGLALNSRLQPIERTLLLEKISDDSRNELQRLMNHDNETTKWFHENGVPQVFQWDHKVFLY